MDTPEDIVKRVEARLQSERDEAHQRTIEILDGWYIVNKYLKRDRREMKLFKRDDLPISLWFKYDLNLDSGIWYEMEPEEQIEYCKALTRKYVKPKPEPLLFEVGPAALKIAKCAVCAMEIADNAAIIYGIGRCCGKCWIEDMAYKMRVGS